MEARTRAQLRANRLFWEDSVAPHIRSALYDVEGFRRGRESLTRIELEEVGPVRGRSLLHLQCHFGMDSISWARHGAQVTGVDFSRAAVRAARQLAREAGVETRFIQSAIYELPRKLTETFDVVYTGRGAIVWLPDLRRWGKVVARFLKPGGRFLLLEDHPWAGITKESGRLPRCRLTGSYFPREPNRWAGQGTYATRAQLAHPVSYDWDHSVSSVLNALAAAGLRIDSVREFPYTFWRRHRGMTKRRDGFWSVPGWNGQVPLMWSVRARR